MLHGEHSAIFLTFIKLQFVIMIFVLSIFEWPFYTGFTVAFNKRSVCAYNTYSSVFLSCRFRRVLGLCYVVVKVKLLVIVEIGVFPLICGWWLDICSLVSI